jgi:hypothetical protein
MTEIEVPLEINLSAYESKINVKKLKNDIEIIKSLFKYKQLGPENVSRVVTETVMKVRAFKKISLIEKTGLATHIINYLIEELIPGRDAPMEAILKLMVPDLVEQLLLFDLSKACSCFKA